MITTLNISNSVVHIDNEFLKTLNDLQHIILHNQNDIEQQSAHQNKLMQSIQTGGHGGSVSIVMTPLKE